MKIHLVCVLFLLEVQNCQPINTKMPSTSQSSVVVKAPNHQQDSETPAVFSSRESATSTALALADGPQAIFGTPRLQRTPARPTEKFKLETTAGPRPTANGLFSSSPPEPTMVSSATNLDLKLRRCVEPGHLFFSFVENSQHLARGTEETAQVTDKHRGQTRFNISRQPYEPTSGAESPAPEK